VESLILTVRETADVIPAGGYQAEFLGVEKCEEDHKEYGPGIRWEFRILDGDYSGKTAVRVTGVEPTKQNACGKMLAQVSGITLEGGASANIADCVGRRFQIQVTPNQSGSGTRVDVVIPLDTRS